MLILKTDNGYPVILYFYTKYCIFIRKYGIFIRKYSIFI
ncbi:unnamed protein product [Arabidopsis halleri]